MLGMVVMFIVEALLSTAGIVYQEAISDYGNSIKTNVQRLTKEISKRLSENASLREKATLAYQNKDSKLANSLAIGLGFGPRARSIKQAMDRNKQEYSNKASELDKARSELESDYNTAANAGAVAGTSIAANSKGDQDTKQLGAKYETTLIDAGSSWGGKPELPQQIGVVY